MGVPQIIWVSLAGISLLIHANKHGQKRDYNFWTDLVGTIASLALLTWGGFFGGGI